MKYRRRLSREILLGCFAFALILGALIAALTLRILGMGLQDQYQARIEAALKLTMARIDAEDLQACMASGAPSEGFAELTRRLDEIRLNCSMDYLVICRPVKEGDAYDVQAVASGLLPNERAGESTKEIPVPQLGESIGAMYPPDFIPVIYEDMLHRRDIKFSVSHTDFGTSYDGAVAILNRDGEGIALLTAGLSATAIYADIKGYVLLIGGGIVLAGALLFLILNVWLDRRVIRPLRLIEQSAADFAAKSRAHSDPEALVLERPDIHSNDELEALANTIVSLSEDMKSYAEKLVRSAVQVKTMRQEITKVTNLANMDALTGVRNKTAFDAKVKRLNGEIAQGKADFALVMIDMNRLKHVNDTYGHEKGDIYLKGGCKLICDTFIHSPVYRVGGDEFVVVLSGIDLASRDVLFDRFRKGMRTDAYLKEWERVSAAMGCAIYDPAKDRSAESVLSRADRAMYENKRASRE